LLIETIADIITTASPFSSSTVLLNNEPCRQTIATVSDAVATTSNGVDDDQNRRRIVYSPVAVASAIPSSIARSMTHLVSPTICRRLLSISEDMNLLVRNITKEAKGLVQAET
jgi:hypothetical protein